MTAPDKNTAVVPWGAQPQGEGKQPDGGAGASGAMPDRPQPTVPRLRSDIADFLRFVRRPTLRRLRPRHPGSGVAADWRATVGLRRLFAWVAILWGVNLFLLGPVAVAVAGAGGAQHRLAMAAIPVFTAIVWAPLVEELLFRYGLRRPQHALWLVPLLLWPLFGGPGPVGGAILGTAMLLSLWLIVRGRARATTPHGAPRHAWGWSWRRRYIRLFPWVVHLAALVFAGMHLANFTLNQTALWLTPLLVLPQWLTGLVLAWMRVRRGIACSLLIHSMFNAGPVLLVLAIRQWAPEVMT